jgi:2-polyprenyl-6-methoxyphenol hydroxylase-like FAD-dependent oxidoreductase
LSEQATQVIIIGGGPAGLTLANELGRRGVATVLFNDRTETSTDPKGNATQARTMEQFRRLGVADAVRARGLPPDYPTDIAYFTRYTAHELARFSLPSPAEARKLVKSLKGSWSTPELPHRGGQMFIEQELLAKAQTYDSVEINFGWRVESFHDKGDHVAVTASDGTARRTVRAQYLAACDGARSDVRRGLGIELAGDKGAVRDFMGGRMHAAFISAPGFYDAVPHDRAWMYWAFNPERRGFVAAIDGSGEFAFHTQLKPEEARGKISESQVRAMITQVFGGDIGFEIISHASWTAGFALVADQFAKARIFLLGDAAHLFTPTGGLGYNTAIEDAVNLGWKLAARLKGYGGAGLLDTYAAERRPNAIRNTGYARKFADSIGLYKPVPELEDDTEAGRAARADAGAYLNAHARAEFNIPGITFGLRYDGSPIIAADGAPPPEDQANVYEATACPGGRAPHLWLDDGRSLFDNFGFEFSCLCLGGAKAPDDLIKAAARRRLPLEIVDVPGEQAYELYQAAYALIRPDQIVCWRGDEAPDDPDALLDKIRGGAPA